MRAAGIDPESELPPFPDAMRDLWRWFMVLNKTRQTGMGSGSVTESEIDALMRNRRIRLSSWECDAIHTLDSKVQGVMAEMNKPKPTKKGK